MSIVIYDDMDRRIRRTKQSFKNHFIRLIMEKGYRNVSVKDIVEHADYNRSTFYHYYKDKEDLANELVSEMLEKMENAFQLPFINKVAVRVNTINPKNLALFNHIYEHKNFYSLLKVDDSIPLIHEKIINKMRTLYDTLIFKSETKENISTEHINTFITYGEFGLIIEWIKDDYRKSPIELAEDMIDIFSNRIYSVRLK